MDTYADLWWVLDPRDEYACCPDCQRLAANSPYAPPYTDGKQLKQSPGDGQTDCGAGCTCGLSYQPPELYQWPPLSSLSAYEQAIRHVPHTKREAIYNKFMGYEE